MTSPYRNEIDQLRQITIISLQRADYLFANSGFDRLSLLYKDELIFYSDLIDKKESFWEKEKIRKELSSGLEEWRTMILFRKRLEEIGLI